MEKYWKDTIKVKPYSDRQEDIDFLIWVSRGVAELEMIRANRSGRRTFITDEVDTVKVKRKSKKKPAPKRTRITNAVGTESCQINIVPWQTNHEPFHKPWYTAEDMVEKKRLDLIVDKQNEKREKKWEERRKKAIKHRTRGKKKRLQIFKERSMAWNKK